MSEYLMPKKWSDIDPVQRLFIQRAGGPVTVSQIEMMLHAIGADNKKARSYGGRKTYHAYRNYYDAGGRDVMLWDNLVSDGFASKRSRFYHVTVDGLRLLERITGATIYDNYDCVADCKVIMLKTIMKHECSCTSGCWMPVSAKKIAEELHMPLDLARQTAKKLVEEGLVEKGYDGGMSCDGDLYCYHGYYLTDKARGLEVYNEILKAEYKYIEGMLNGKNDQSK